ncbi:MAG: outer membrane beta-barrel domain-containing protein [Bdellovibrionales bacterium]|nr:outer membrane beta-barrel domain-containing protein [Bdellovibrionales bacterium]
MIRIISFIVLLSGYLAFTAGSLALADGGGDKSILNDLDSLANNKAIVKRAKAIDANNRIRVVQNRSVDRNLRLEFGLSYDGVTGGDSYLRTNNLGYSLDFHITPKISIGGRYYDSNSRLTSEGDRVFSEANQARLHGDNTLRPDIDIPLSSSLGLISIYPLYGKLNFFNQGITQFDLYFTGGYGKMKLSSGETPTWMAGGGVGIWWSQHFSSRLEVRYQEYEDSIRTGNRDQAITAFSIGFGFLL